MELTLGELVDTLSNLPQTCTSCDDVDVLIKVQTPQQFMDKIVDLRLAHPNKDFMVRILPYKRDETIIGRLQMK